MKSIYLSLLFCCFSHCLLLAQSNPLDKKLEKAKELVNKGKVEKADEFLVDLLKEHPDYGDGWDYLVKLRYEAYEDSKKSDNLFANLTITTTDKQGKAIKNDSLAGELTQLLSNVSPSKTAFNKFLYTARLATASSLDADASSYYLRILMVDQEVDTAVSKKALKFFDDAEEEFSKKNYNSAAKLYQRAIEIQPDFYKASLYLGDCFYFLEDYLNAIKYFKSASEKFPTFLEPRKYLIDAYYKQGLFQEAINESINSFKVYPDFSIYNKLENATYYNNKIVDIRWTPRGCLPNKVPADSLVKKYNEYTPEGETVKGPWTAYKNALQPIKNYCDAKGKIVKPNNLTTSKYLEIYSWEEMLKNNPNDTLLEEARRFQKDGYLDCYVMIYCFHHDFYEQYLDYVKNNDGRIQEYFKKYIVTKK
jgi:tetratricopeptide (TPR) repeat protein